MRPGILLFPKEVKGAYLPSLALFLLHSPQHPLRRIVRCDLGHLVNRVLCWLQVDSRRLRFHLRWIRKNLFRLLRSQIPASNWVQLELKAFGLGLYRTEVLLIHTRDLRYVQAPVLL